tara:strand:- start:86 stop:301 length:216 start_codon:yes stop_codon:yes gene_type:complete
MEIIYTLAGIVLMLFTCLITWINWKILRVSEDLLDISKILLDETVQIRKGLSSQKDLKIPDKPIIGVREYK